MSFLSPWEHELEVEDAEDEDDVERELDELDDLDENELDEESDTSEEYELALVGVEAELDDTSSGNSAAST